MNPAADIPLLQRHHSEGGSSHSDYSEEDCDPDSQQLESSAASSSVQQLMMLTHSVADSGLPCSPVDLSLQRRQFSFSRSSDPEADVDVEGDADDSCKGDLDQPMDSAELTDEQQTLPFHCDLCGKAFGTVVCLQEHSAAAHYSCQSPATGGVSPIDNCNNVTAKSPIIGKKCHSIASLLPPSTPHHRFLQHPQPLLPPFVQPVTPLSLSGLQSVLSQHQQQHHQDQITSLFSNHTALYSLAALQHQLRFQHPQQHQQHQPQQLPLPPPQSEPLALTKSTPPSNNNLSPISHLAPVAMPELSTESAESSCINGSSSSSSSTTCGICGKCCSCRSALEIHMRTHTKEKPFACGHCGKGFSTKGNMRQHELTHRRLVIRPTPTLAEPQALLEQKEAAGHTAAAADVVAVQPKPSLPSPVSAIPQQQHPNQHRQLRNSCERCGKQCPTRSSLEIHLRSHTGEKPYRCDGCGKRFSTHGNMQAHVRRHCPLSRDSLQHQQHQQSSMASPAVTIEAPAPPSAAAAAAALFPISSAFLPAHLIQAFASSYAAPFYQSQH